MMTMWSNERIGASLVALANEDGELTADDIMYLIYGIRDEYQTQVASLEGTLAEVREIIKYVDDYAYAWDDLEQLLFGEIDEELDDAAD